MKKKLTHGNIYDYFITPYVRKIKVKENVTEKQKNTELQQLWPKIMYGKVFIQIQ